MLPWRLLSKGVVVPELDKEAESPVESLLSNFLKRSEVIPSDLFFGIGQTYLDCAGVVEFFFCVRLCGDLLCFVCSGVAVFIDSIWLHWRISVVVCAWAVMLNIWGFLDGLWQCQSPNVSSFNLAWPGLFTKTDYLLPLVGLALSQW